jgi:conjugative transfer region lipoprotein (TIGR03751 family)
MGMPIETARLAARHAHNSTDGRRAPCLWMLCVALASCASGSKLSTLPSDGPTMAEVYRQHMAGRRGPSTDGGASHPQGGENDRSQAGRYQRTVADEVDNRFARLPNPDLVMYVTPHLSPNGRYPVPGYSTVFPMYESVEYAMPGEVPLRRVAVEPAAPVRARTAAAEKAK